MNVRINPILVTKTQRVKILYFHINALAYKGLKATDFHAKVARGSVSIDLKLVFPVYFL